MYKKKLENIFLEISEIKDREKAEYEDMLKNRYEEEYSASEIEYTKERVEALYSILYGIYQLIK